MVRRPSFFEILPQFRPQTSVAVKSQMRRHPRLPFEIQIQLSWKDPRGKVQNLRASCLDLSAEGARLQTDAPIPLRTSVTLNSARYGNLGAASVRHCVRHTLKYSIGVEFTASLALAGQARKRCLAEIHPPPAPPS